MSNQKVQLTEEQQQAADQQLRREMTAKLLENVVVPIHKYLGDKWLTAKKIAGKFRMSEDEVLERMRICISLGIVHVKKGGVNYKHQNVFKMAIDHDTTIGVLEEEKKDLERRIVQIDEELSRLKAKRDS